MQVYKTLSILFPECIYISLYFEYFHFDVSPHSLLYINNDSSSCISLSAILYILYTRHALSWLGYIYIRLYLLFLRSATAMYHVPPHTLYPQKCVLTGATCLRGCACKSDLLSNIPPNFTPLLLYSWNWKLLMRACASIFEHSSLWDIH